MLMGVERGGGCGRHGLIKELLQYLTNNTGLYIALILLDETGYMIHPVAQLN